ncbi:hypothetical protein [Tindallia californiensis]|uniref:Uncharacterized protein n=1 Tax=Tindallia californiensis TaxID=159292 RepID=A0A1H3R1B4_9FIRM|nr:hypothetical protein [Tindallia californiensis]SDZ18729.1 hypothetical protein SAMN05192546_11143 [Tindallia californiensis]
MKQHTVNNVSVLKGLDIGLRPHQKALTSLPSITGNECTQLGVKAFGKQVLLYHCIACHGLV